MTLLAGTWVEGQALSMLLWAVSVWVFGAIIGMLLPRPKWFEATNFNVVLLASPAGILLKRVALAFHGAYLLRELWYQFTSPGTFHSVCRAVWGCLRGRGFRYEAPLVLKKGKTRKGDRSDSLGKSGELNWCVTPQDLQFFKERVEEDAPVPGAGAWEHMMEKDFGHFTYEAWRRTLPGNKTEYKSVTVAENATAEEFMDFYLDDPTRPKWDNMIVEHEILENGSPQHRCQVVRWVRSFPFSFLSKREYIIGRRLWRGPDGCLYGITKAVEHPHAPPVRNIVRMDAFHSMWRSRTIPCPKGSPHPACETVLLHHEQFKIPENLARFAVRHGMGGFVKKMGPEVAAFVEARRQRCGAFEPDPDAFGVRGGASPPLARSDSGASLASCTASSDSDDSEAATARFPRRRQRRGNDTCEPANRLRRAGVAAVAVAIALAIGRSSAKPQR